MPSKGGTKGAKKPARKGLTPEEQRYRIAQAADVIFTALQGEMTFIVEGVKDEARRQKARTVFRNGMVALTMAIAGDDPHDLFGASLEKVTDEVLAPRK